MEKMLLALSAILIPLLLSGSALGQACTNPNDGSGNVCAPVTSPNGKWMLLNHAADTNSGDHGCYASKQIAFATGALIITMTKPTTSPTCGQSTTTAGSQPYLSGSMVSVPSFSPSTSCPSGTCTFLSSIKIGRGWPSFWMLGGDGLLPTSDGCQYQTIYNTWDNAGNCNWSVDADDSSENDIMEYTEPNYGTTNQNLFNNNTQNGESQSLSTPYSNFHTYGMSWSNSSVSYSVDGTASPTLFTATIPTHPMFMILENRVNSVIPPSFPQVMTIQYVQVCDGTSCTNPGNPQPSDNTVFFDNFTQPGTPPNVATPSVDLNSSANPSVIGQAVTFTAMIRAPADLTVPPSPGTITFEGLPDGNVSIPIMFAGGGTNGPFTAAATYETAGLPAGSTLITAAFPGDSFLKAASASLTQVVNPPATYQLVDSPMTIELKAGAPANNSVTITVKSLYGFTGTVSLSCKVVYLGSGTDASSPTCGFATNPLSVNGSDISTHLIVATTTATAADGKVAGNGGLDKGGIVLWGGVLLLLLPGRLRYRWLAATMMILVVSGSMLSLSSCGGTGGSAGPPSPAGPQTGNYSITVSATSDTTAPAPPPVTILLTAD